VCKSVEIFKRHRAVPVALKLDRHDGQQLNYAESIAIPTEAHENESDTHSESVSFFFFCLVDLNNRQVTSAK
jgi:hypothetical protein